VPSGASSHSASRGLPALFSAGTAAGRGDHELLSRFAARRGADDEAAAVAFAALVERHGPMVLRVCLAVLGDRHDAEDAFQATFLVLADRAGTIRSGDSVGSWLHGVALRASSRARAAAARRRRHERRRAEMVRKREEAADEARPDGEDLARVLHEEIGRLSEKFRAAVVLCYLEGLTHESAAGRLGCPVGTVRSRLATARERLQKRLTRRGVAPAVSAAWLASNLGGAAEAASRGAGVPAALAEGAVRGALRIHLGKAALGGIVSAEAVALTEGVLTSMSTTKLIIAATSFLAAGLLTAGVGVRAYSTLGRAPGQAPAASPPQAATSKAPDRAKDLEEAKAKYLRRNEDEVKALIREYQEKEDATRAGLKAAKTPEERTALIDKRANPAAYAGALLQLAEQAPGTPQAEQALVWIAAHLTYGSMDERAKEMLARDHADGAGLEPVFRPSQIHMYGSRATERLFREVLAKNPDRNLRCLACFNLARFLDTQATTIRLMKLSDPKQWERTGAPIIREGWGRDYEERVAKLDPVALGREAESLYQRTIAEFGDVPLPNPLPWPVGDRLLPSGPETFGESSRIYLRELTELGVGRPAPEIEGVDVDGKPMKLSDYRGKVVAIYFCGPVQLGDNETGKPAVITEMVRDAALRHAGASFALLGVACSDPSRVKDRETFRKLLRDSGLPARFWFDWKPDGSPGPIQAAWDLRGGLYLIDRRGVIRFKNTFAPELLEKALDELLTERTDEPGRAGAGSK
jgi:RNA polymerase sigma factor (sigma-70 family)